MTSANFRRTLVGAAVATALGVLGSPAGAAPYRGAFDPTSFSGVYDIDVDPTCLTLGNGWYANGGICGAMTLTGIYADVNSDDVSPEYHGRLTWAPPDITSDTLLYGIYVYGGQIDSFDTAVLGPQVTTSQATTDSWYIKFTSGMMPAPEPCPYCYGPLLAAAQVFDDTTKGVYLYLNGATDPIDRASYLGPAQVVPEPGTLTLLLGALGGGWLARRKRKEKVPDTN